MVPHYKYFSQVLLTLK